MVIIRARWVAAASLLAVWAGVGMHAAAQSSNNCIPVKAEIALDQTNPLDVGGPVTNAGILTGSARTVFPPIALPTPDATTVSFIGNTTITTNRGALSTSDVFTWDVARSLGAAFHRIDSAASTGIFQGATGVLFGGATQTSATTITEHVTGQVCF